MTELKINDAGLRFQGNAPAAGEMKTVDAIVLHHRAGNGDVLSIHLDHLKRGWWGIGYHFYIRKNGEIWRGRPENITGAHAGGSNTYNLHSIGICLEGDFETEYPTDPQLDSLAILLQDLENRYPIREVLYHREIAPTACPGKHFPKEDEIMERLQPQEWYTAAVNWAVRNQIMQGAPGGDLMLDKPMTRKEFATMLYRFWQLNR